MCLLTAYHSYQECKVAGEKKKTNSKNVTSYSCLPNMDVRNSGSTYNPYSNGKPLTKEERLKMFEDRRSQLRPTLQGTTVEHLVNMRR